MNKKMEEHYNRDMIKLILGIIAGTITILISFITLIVLLIDTIS